MQTTKLSSYHPVVLHLCLSVNRDDSKLNFFFEVFIFTFTSEFLIIQLQFKITAIQVFNKSNQAQTHRLLFGLSVKL